LCELGETPALAVGYDASRAGATGFADFEALAERHGFDLVRTPDINDPDLVRRIDRIQPAVVFVIGWSQLVRSRLLDVPTHGCVGIHPTKLPEGRGRAPIPWTILKGLERTASTMFFLTEGVDDGDLIGQVEIDVAVREDAGTLYSKHRAAHVELIRRYYASLLKGTVVGSPQNHTDATVWPRRVPEDGRIDWDQSGEEVDRLVRAVTHPFPGAFTDRGSDRVTIWRSAPGPHLGLSPGRWVRREDGVYVACGHGSLRVLEFEGPA
jgi:methionyl-tRNA formyltransferase